MNRPFLKFRAAPLAMRNPFALFAFVACCLFAHVALAQSSTATLSGDVVDQNGAVVPGAEVKIVNTATAFSRQTMTSDAGSYVFPLLPPGTYNVTVQRDGFSPVRVENVVLNVGDQKALQIQLKAGDVNAAVTVNADAETVRTDGSVGTVINRQFVSNIPLNGRSLQALIQLTPGVVLTPAQGGVGGTGTTQFSVNGNRTTANTWMVDGVSANTGMSASNGNFPGASGSGQTPGTTALGGTNSLVSLDALQEFRIETSSYAPEFGRTPGGQISLVTRPGTNQFHGSASYYWRNEALDANDWFANANRRPKPKERQSFFGGVLGGPIRRDRFFFFGSYEGLRLQQPRATITTVPTAALRAQSVPFLQPYMNALPLPNGRDFGNGTAQFSATYSDPGEFNIFSLRLDGRFTNSLTGFFRIGRGPSNVKTRANSLSTVTSVRANNSVYTGGLTWVPDSRFTADLRINWTRNSARILNDLDAFGGATMPQKNDVFAPGRDPSTAQFQYSFTQGGSFIWGPGTSDVQRQFNVVGAVARGVGSHQLKVGVDYRRLLPLLGATGGSLEALFISNPTAAQALFYNIGNSDQVPRQAVITSLSLFWQDTWHATTRLTLTYGLRFERVPPPSEATGRPPRTVLGIENDPPQNPRLAPQGTSLFRSRLGEFAPRFGAAYQLSTRPGWEATLRGGAGIYYDLGLGNIATAFQLIYPFFGSRPAFNAPLPLSGAARTPPVLGVDPPGQFWLLDPNLRMPYTVEWNATFDQGIGSGQSVNVAYVGAAGRRLLVLQNYRQPLAEWPTSPTTLQIQRNLGSSAYNALQVQYQRRLSRRGLQALASYTLMRSRDNTSTDAAFAPPNGQAGLLAQEYGPSDFDVRHLLSAALTYELPNVSGSALLRDSVNGWGLDFLIRYQSAFPVSPTVGFVTLPSTGTGFFPRPNLVPGQPLYINDPAAPGGRRFNRAAFVAPPSGQQGNFPRNGLRGFPVSQLDLALRREFKFGERIHLQFRAELFNLFNHPNFGAPNNSINDGNFGRSTSMLNGSLGGLNALYQIGGPRSGQLAVKFIF